MFKSVYYSNFACLRYLPAPTSLLALLLSLRGVLAQQLSHLHSQSLAVKVHYYYAMNTQEEEPTGTHFLRGTITKVVLDERNERTPIAIWKHRQFVEV